MVELQSNIKLNEIKKEKKRKKARKKKGKKIRLKG